MTVGVILPAASIGFGAIMIRPTRGFFQSGDAQPIIAQATIEEVHIDEIEITDHPVEQGARIADHAFKRPSEVTITCAWSDSPSGGSTGIVGAAISGLAGVASALNPIVGLVNNAQGTVSAASSLLGNSPSSRSAQIYDQLLKLQESMIPFDVYTGKKVYKNMLFKALTTTTDQKWEKGLLIKAHLRQVIIVTTQTVKVPINVKSQALPQTTTPVQNTGVNQIQSGANKK